MIKLDLTSSAERLAREYASTIRQGKGVVIESNTLTEKGLDSFVNGIQCAIEKTTESSIIANRVPLTAERGFSRFCLFSPDSPAAQKLRGIIRSVKMSSFKERDIVPEDIHLHNNKVRERYLRQVASKEVKDVPVIQVD